MMHNGSSIARPVLLASMLAISVAFSHLAGAQSVQLLLIRGDSLLDADKPQRALDIFDQAVKREATPATLLARSRAYYKLDRMERFVQDIDRVLRMDSTNGEAHFQRGIYSLQANDSDRAEFHGARAIEHARNDRSKAKALNVRGEARAERKHYAEAAADLAQAWALGLEDVPAMRTLARLYDGEGQYAEALRVLERLCELDPSDMGNWTNRANELNMLGRYEEAISMADRALSSDKDEPVAMSHKAYALTKLERDADAWPVLDRSLRNYPSNPFALRTRAILRLRKGERAKACDDLTLAKALAEIPEVDRMLIEHCDGEKPKR
jgi:tetratricopeptide (TPR) repeat protein